MQVTCKGLKMDGVGDLRKLTALVQDAYESEIKALGLENDEDGCHQLSEALLNFNEEVALILEEVATQSGVAAEDLPDGLIFHGDPLVLARSLLGRYCD